MALVNFIGQETGIGSEQVNSDSPTNQVTSPVISGRYVLQVIPVTTDIAYRGYGDPSPDGGEGGFSLSTMYFSFRYRYAAKPAANDEEFMVLTQGTNHRLGLRIDSAGHVLVYDRVGTLKATGSQVLSQDATYRISGNIVLGAAGSYSVKIRDPDTDAILETLSGTADTGTTNFTTNRYGKFVDRNDNSVEYYYDDIIFDNSTEPGNWRIALARAIANGSTMQWTSGTNASDYQEVDDIPFSATDYVRSTGAGNELALFRFETLAQMGISGATIKGVKMQNRVREHAAGTSSNVGRFISGATTVDSTARDLTTTSIETSMLFENDPNTSAAWTEAAFDAIEGGSFETSTNSVRMEAIGLMVLYDPSTIPTFKQQTIFM